MDTLLELAEAVVDSADDAGCTEDLTVVDAAAIEKLRAHIISVRRSIGGTT